MTLKACITPNFWRIQKNENITFPRYGCTPISISITKMDYGMPPKFCLVTDSLENTWNLYVSSISC